MSNYKMIDGVKIPAVWAICGQCNGEGMSSAYLGAFTREEFDEAFDYEEQERYFAGEYDRQCDVCHGSGKVKHIDEDRLTPEQREVVQSYYDHMAELRQERRMREMGYQF